MNACVRVRGFMLSFMASPLARIQASRKRLGLYSFASATRLRRKLQLNRIESSSDFLYVKKIIVNGVDLTQFDFIILIMLVLNTNIIDWFI